MADELYWAGLTQWAARVEQAAAFGLADGMLVAEAAGQDTDAYRGVTGATRAGTVGYVPGVNDNKFDAAADAVIERNPDHLAVIDDGRAPEGIIRGVLTTPTDYQVDLEFDNAGQRSWIPDAIYTTAPRIMQAIVTSLRDAF